MLVFTGPAFSQSETDFKTAAGHENPAGGNVPETAGPSNIQAVFTLSMGLRQDDFDWTIAGDRHGNNPNIRSELTWSRVDSYQIKLANRTRIGDLLCFKGYFAYAWVDDGQVQDSDYNGDDRTGEYSRSLCRSTGDQLWDLSIGIGHPFRMDKITITPLIGGSVHKQNFRMTDGEQVLGPPLGELDGLDSTFRSKWKGYWFGIDCRYDTKFAALHNIPMTFNFLVECHPDVDYSAEANWNLRSDLAHPKSFEQEASGSGIVFEAEWVIGLRPSLDLSVAASYQQWQTGSGTNRFHNSDGAEVKTRLNSVDWCSHSFQVGIAYHFF